MEINTKLNKMKLDIFTLRKEHFCNGVAIAYRTDGKSTYINDRFKFLRNEWFEEAYAFKNKFGIIKRGDGWNFINKKGDFLCKEWFDALTSFNNGFARVFRDGKVSFIREDGTRLTDRWFTNAENFKNGFANVWINHNKMFIDKNGDLHEFKNEK